MALGDMGIPHPGGRRKKDAIQLAAAVALGEGRVGIPQRNDDADIEEGASGWRDTTPLPDDRDRNTQDIDNTEAVDKYRDPGPEDFKHLGKLLLYLRQSYFDRMSGGDSDRPRSELKAAAVVDYLRKHNYSMTSGSYSMLEQGKTLPRNPEQFLDIISRCFRVDRSSKYWVLLRRQYVYDHTLRFVGKEYADQVTHGSAFLRSLRDEPPATDSSRP